MNEQRRPSPLEHVNAALELVLTAAVIYRFATGEDPLELARGWVERGRAWLHGRSTYRRAMLDTLEGIRDLPETEEK